MYLSIAIFFVLKNCIILLLPENLSFRNDSKKEITFLINEYKSDILKLVIYNKELFKRISLGFHCRTFGSGTIWSDYLFFLFP